VISLCARKSSRNLDDRIATPSSEATTSPQKQMTPLTAGGQAPSAIAGNGHPVVVRP
jgi:hypothetical protein